MYKASKFYHYSSVHKNTHKHRVKRGLTTYAHAKDAKEVPNWEVYASIPQATTT